jgi:outer membrane biosynthesis protein TonB
MGFLDRLASLLTASFCLSRLFVFAPLNIKVVLILNFNWVKVLRNKARTATSIIVVASLFVVFAMLLAINQLVNVTLYDYGLQYSLNWSNPYVLYLDLAILLVIIDVFLVGIVEIAYPALKNEEPERNSPSTKSVPMVSTPKVSPLPPVAEEKRAISPEPSRSAPPNKETQKSAVATKPVTEQRGREELRGIERKPMTNLGYCTSCGTKRNNNALYCKNCGKKLE